MNSIFQVPFQHKDQKKNFDEPKKERVLIVAIDQQKAETWGVQESLDELERLIDTAGGIVVQRVVQRRLKPHVSLYMGTGKINELRRIITDNEVDLVVADDELSPAQVRNMEEALDIPVIDRSQVILDIFAQRAQTKEGRLQVELAQLEYLLPRLAGQGIALSRLGGGIGTRGPGETKLETDRRRIRRRIADLKREVERVKKQRDLHRARRERSLVPVVSLVGYTNAGKSTLMSALTGADVFIEDALFATLDPTIRSVADDGGPGFLLVDTVGFINKLPHELVAAFRATLEEVVESDIIIHVVDVSNEHFAHEQAVVHQVLSELGASHKPVITAFNKIDRVSSQHMLRTIQQTTGNSVLISAVHRRGLSELIEKIEQNMPDPLVVHRYNVPFTKGEVVQWLYDNGRVLEEQHQANGTILQVELPQSMAERVKSYRLA